jgi:hypothetical protein
MLKMAKLATSALSRPGTCVLLARWGADPAGVAAVETSLDIAFTRWLWVTPALRRRGVGTALINSVREAARTRGARQLHALTLIECGKFMERCGFVTNSMADAFEVINRNFVIDFEREYADFPDRRPDLTDRYRAWLLDISSDGIVIR